MTIALAEEILKREALGRGPAPDMLCISLSSLDFVSHQYGPDSLEAEDTLYRVDALLEAFFVVVDNAVGMDKTLVVLTADHGFTRSPEEAAADGMPAVRLAREDTARLLGELRAELGSRFALPPEAVQGFLSPFVYLDRAAVAGAGAPLDAVQRAAAETVLRWPGVAWTAGRGDLLAGRVPRTKFHDRAAVSLSPARGGDVLVALKPGCLIETAETGYPATHGSPHAADTRVPVLFLGAGVAPARVYRPVSPLDIAATVAAALGITPPPCCVGEPLPEIVPSSAPKS